MSNSLKPWQRTECPSDSVCENLGCLFLCGPTHGKELRVPPKLLYGELHKEQPCLTPVDCVQYNTCLGTCNCGNQETPKPHVKKGLLITSRGFVEILTLKQRIQLFFGATTPEKLQAAYAISSNNT